MNKYFIPYFGLIKAHNDLRFDLLMCYKYMTYQILSSTTIILVILSSLLLLF